MSSLRFVLPQCFEAFLIIPTQAININWKDPEKALTKMYPRVEEGDAEESDLPIETGSFFNFFELASDPCDVSWLETHV